jgi:NAD(P)-dependent dehydrogenase (short-subunit alcohol dehydrogenase family)/DNA-binding transcriptional MerR regulator
MKTEFSIQQVAQQTGLSIDTLRYYERVGLIASVSRASNGYRRYTQDDLNWIFLLIRLRETDMPLSQIIQFVQMRRQGPQTLTERRMMLEHHQHNLEQRMQRLEQNMNALQYKIERYKERELSYFSRRKQMPITSPFSASSTALEVIAGHDLTGKTALVTGANSGLGLETTRALLTAKAEVILAVRDTMKGEQVAQALRTTTGNARAHVLSLDLGSLAGVRQAAEEFQTRWSRLDILINNAGIMAVPQNYTPDGFEMHFGTNHLGHFLLTLLLLPALKAAAPSRVVVLSSSAHRRSDICFDDLQYRSRPYDKWEAYGQSKTANALFAVGLTRHCSNQGITANAVNPGATHTGLQQHFSQEDLQTQGWVDEKGKWVQRWKSPEQGAATSLWAAVGQELEGIGGRYLEDCQEATALDPKEPYPGHGYLPYALDPDHAEQLWTLSQGLVGLVS